MRKHTLSTWASALILALFICTVPCIAQDMDQTTFFGEWADEKSKVTLSVVAGKVTGTMTLDRALDRIYTLNGNMIGDLLELELVAPHGSRESWTGRFEYGHVTNFNGTWKSSDSGKRGTFSFTDDPNFLGD